MVEPELGIVVEPALGVGEPEFCMVELGVCVDCEGSWVCAYANPIPPKIAAATTAEVKVFDVFIGGLLN